MKNNLLLSDILILTKVFFSRHTLDFNDPLKKILFNKKITDINENRNNLHSVLINNDSESIITKIETSQPDFIIDFSQKNNFINGYSQAKFCYINNSDGSMRWVFPNTLETPSFLNFYCASKLRSKLYVLYVQVLFWLGLKNIIAPNSFTIYHRYSLIPDEYVGNHEAENFSIFMGTIGPNRKAIIEINKYNQTLYYVKVPMNKEASNLVVNEVNTINKLSSLNLKCMKIPTLTNVYGSITNLKREDSKRSNKINKSHINGLSELYDKTVQFMFLENSAYANEIKTNIEALPEHHRNASISQLSIKLKLLSDVVISQAEPIAFSTAHNDFTPWNCYEQKDTIAVYDWEMSGMAPLLHDVFHYIFQSEVMINHRSLSDIRSEIDYVLELSDLKKLVSKYGINVELHLHLYLLKNISSTLHLYSKQGKLHIQAYWIMNVWNEALSELLSKYFTNNSYRKAFIKELFSVILPTNYVLMKYCETKMNLLPSSTDLDILIDKQYFTQLMLKINNSQYVLKTQIHKKSFMNTVEVYFKDGSFLSLDFLFSFMRKDLQLLDPKVILGIQGKTSDGVLVPQKRYDFEYKMLFYQLNKAKMPDKHIEYYESLSTGEKSSIVQYIQHKYNIEVSDLAELYEYEESIGNHLEQFIKKQPFNQGLLRLTNKYNYIIDTFQSIASQRGFAISVSGVDGAGKSTVIQMLKDRIEKKYRKKVIILRHRPSILPILSSLKYGRKEAETKAASQLPRLGKNMNLVSSIFRFAYYYLDYLVGQVYVSIKYFSRGHIIIYDRFYFDFINDSVRSNIRIPKFIPKLLFGLVLKPKLNVLLYASPDEILRRKKELSYDDIVELNKSYIGLFEKLSLSQPSTKYITINNIYLYETMSTIEKEFCKVA